MGRLWTDQSRWSLWLSIEILSCEAWEREGRIPKEAVAVIRKKAKINPKRIEALEAEVKHDVIAFVSAVAETIGPDARHLHFGLTSSDVVDTAFACQLKKASELLLEDLETLLKALKKLALQYKRTPMIGRTHGIHAEPITFGWKVAGWLAEVARQLERLEEAKKTISVGKISGAVGTYAHISPQIEKYILDRLGLVSEDVATQVVARDRHAFFFGVLAGVASTLEKIAIEIRHLARTEVAEVAEPFGKGQKGSSAMPHKRNPVLSENVTGLARLIRAYAQAALENVALWHERDISHSSVERVIAPDATIALDFMIHRLVGVLEGLEVYPDRMKKNLEATRGLIFSQEVLLALVEAGLKREEAYQIVQKHALAAWKDGEDFKARIEKDAIVKKTLDARQLKNLFDWKKQIQQVDQVLARTLGR